MLGNAQAKKTFELLLDQVRDSRGVRFPFVIVEDGPGVGAFSWVIDQLDDLVSPYAQDMMTFRDRSEVLGKQHVFKVNVKPKDQKLKITDDHIVPERGSRQIIDRLSLAPAGKTKVVLIQHIERMNLSAANAFLKSFEEPLPGRLIIGTSRKMDSLLDTISSRACLIRTVPPTHDQLTQKWMKTSGQNIDAGVLSTCIALSHGEDTLMKKLLDEPTIIALYHELQKLVFSQKYGYRIVQVVKELGSHIADVRVMEALMVRASETEQHHLISRLSLAQKMIAANVNKDHVWFGLGVGE